MQKPKQASARLVDLGPASKRTQGPDGRYVDLVRMMEHWGIGTD